MSEFVAKVTAELDTSKAQSDLQALSNTAITLNNIKPNTSSLVSAIQSALNQHSFSININGKGINTSGLTSSVSRIGTDAGHALSQSISNALYDTNLSTALARTERDSLKQTYNQIKNNNNATKKEIDRAYQEFTLADKRYTTAVNAENKQREQIVKSGLQQGLNEQKAALNKEVVNARKAANIEQQVQRQRINEANRTAREMSKLGSSRGLLTGDVSDIHNISNQLKDSYSTGRYGYGNTAVQSAGSVSVAGKEFRKFNVETQRSDGTIQRYTAHVNALTGEIYELNKGITETSKINAKASKQTPAVFSGGSAASQKMQRANTGALYSGVFGNIYKDAYDDVYGNTYKSAANGVLANGGSIVSANKAGNFAVKTQKINEFGEALNNVSESATKYIALPIAAATAASIKSFTDYETAFTGVRKTVDGTDAELQAVSDGIESMALRVPVASTELAGIAQMGGQLGVPTQNLLDFTEAYAALQVATNLQGEEGAATLARFMNVMGEDFSKVENVGSAIVDLGNHTATTEKEIANLAMRMGSSASIIGISTSDVLGYSAALSALGIQAEMGGSAMTRIWQEIDTSVSEGGDGLEIYAKKAQMSADDFAKAWKSNPTEAFNALLKGLSESEDIIGDLGELGVGNIRDIQTLEKLAGRYDLVQASLQRANQAYREGTALQVEADRAYDTTASKLQMAKESIVQAARDIGGALAPVVVDIGSKVSQAAQAFASLDEGTQKNIATSALWTAGSIVAVNAAGKLVTTIGTVRTGVAELAKLLKTTPAALGKVGIAIGAVAVAAKLGKEAYDAWYESEYLWADSFSEQSKELQKSVDSYVRLNDLKSQYEQAKLVLSNPDASTEELDAAKSKIEEIKSLLEQEYNLKIKSDTTDLDEAFNILTSRERHDVMTQGGTAMEEMRGLAEKYQKNEGRLKEYDEQFDILQRQTATLTNVRLEADKLQDAWDSGAISVEDYNAKMSELENTLGEAGIIAKTGNRQFPTADALVDQLDTTEKSLNNKIEALNEDYATALDQRDKFKTAISDSTDSFSKLLANDVQSGNTDDIGYSIAKLYDIGRTVKETGLSTDDVAKSFAAAKTGYLDFQDAINNGKAADISQNFIDYKKTIDDFTGSEQQVISQAALMKNGFSEVTPAVQQSQEAIQGIVKDMQLLGQQNGQNYTAQQLTDMAHAINLIPDNKSIEFDVNTGSIEVVDNTVTDLEQKIQSINDNNSATIDLKVEDDGSISIIDTIDGRLKELQAQGVNLEIKPNIETGKFDLFGNGNKIGTVTAEGQIEWADTEMPETEPVTQEVIPEPTSQPEFDSTTVDVEPQPGPLPDFGTTDVGVNPQPTSQPEFSDTDVGVNPQPTSQPQFDNANVNVTPVLLKQPTFSSLNGTVNYNLGTYPESVPEAKSKANFDLGTSPTTVPDANGVANYVLGDHPTTAPTIYGTAKYTVQIEGNAGVDGTAHVNGAAYTVGTAYAQGTAFAHGDWGADTSGVALMGELKPELLVRDGKWQLVGGDGAGFYKFRKGDIIFNGDQTEQILQKGKITHGKRRGKAFADGTTYSGIAFADGTDDEESDSKSKEKEPTPEDFDWIEIAFDRLGRSVEKLDSVMEDSYISFEKRNNALMQKTLLTKQEIEWQQIAYNRYKEQADSIGLDESWAAKVRDGTFDIDTVTDDDLKEKINDYQEWYEKMLDCEDAIVELRQTEKELHQEVFDNIITEFDNVLSTFEYNQEVLDKQFSKAQERGLMDSTKYYEASRKNEVQKMEQLNAKREELIASLNQAINAGEIEEYSEAWYEMQQEINDVSLAILDSTTALSEFDNKMRQITWDRFDYAIDSVSRLTDEADFLIELLDHKDLYNDDGSLSEYGNATMGLHGLNYNVYMEEALAYKEAIKQIDEALQNSPYDTNLLERREELLDLQRENILAAEDEKDAILDLVNEGVEQELDSMRDLIDSYIDALDAEKDLCDYRNKIADKTKDIASIQKQLAAYENDNSEETQATIQKLKVELEDAQKDLEDMQYEQYIDDQKALLNGLYDQYEGLLNAQTEDVDRLISDAIDTINDNSSSIQSTLTAVANDVGTSLTSEMNTVWSEADKAIQLYSGNASGFYLKADGYFSADNKISTGTQQSVNDTLASVNNLAYHASGVADYITNMDKWIDIMKSNSLNWYTADEDMQSYYAQQNTSHADYLGLSKGDDGNYYDTDGNLSYSLSDDEKIRAMVDAMKENSAAWNSATAAERSKLESNNVRMANYISNITGEEVYKDGDGVWWIGSRQLYSAYKNGVYNLNKDQMAWTQEHGSEVIIRPSDGAILTPLAKGDSVLSSKASSNIFDFANNPSGFIESMTAGSDLSGLTPVLMNGGNYNGDINMELILPNVTNYEQFKYAMQHDESFEKMIKSMTVDRLTGKSSLRKYKY